MKDDGEENDPQRLGVLVQHRSADSHTIEDGMEAETPHRSLVGMAVVDLLHLVFLRALDTFSVLMLMLVLMFMLVLMLMLMLMTMAVGMAASAHPPTSSERNHR